MTNEYIGIIGTTIGTIIGFGLSWVKQIVEDKKKTNRIIEIFKSNIKLLIKKQEQIIEEYSNSNFEALKFFKQTTSNFSHYYNLYENYQRRQCSWANYCRRKSN